MFKILPKPRAITSNCLYIVVPKHLYEEVLKHYHNSEIAGHTGVKKTKMLIINSGKLRWRNMNTDIGKFVAAYQQIKDNKNYNYKLSNTASERPFQKIALDYFGPLPKSAMHQNQYILVVIDSFTRYVELYPMKSTQAMEFAS